MSTVKISELALINQLNANTSNTLFVAVDVPTGVTGKFTGHTLAQGLYSNEILNVGLNQSFLPNTIAQFSLAGASYIQTNLVNLDDGGTADIVVTANANSGGTDSAYFVDMGFANANVTPGLEFNNLGTALRPLDGYIYAQGNGVGNAPARGGNLIIGATSTNTEIKFIAGGYNSQNIVAKITGDGFKMVNGHPIFFTDGSTQNTAANPIAFSQASFDKSNSAITLGQSGYAQANAAYTKANNALANTDGAVFGGTLNVSGDIRTNGFVYANVIGSSYANTIQWYPAATVPAQTDGQLWYNGNTKNLIADTDIANDRPGVGKVLYERVYNNSGGLIDANTWVRLAGAVTTNSVPHIVYADASSAANSVVTGFVKNAIANGAYGFVYVRGIVDDLTLAGYTPGDLIFLSTTPGQASNVAPYGQSLSTIALGKVIKDSGLNGKIQVDVIPAPAYGKVSGSIMYANNNLIVASNTININETSRTLTMNGIITIQSSTFAANSSGVRIDGSNNGIAQATTSTGTMLQLVGLDGGFATRMILDNYSANNTLAYPLLAGRGARGSASNPLPLQTNDIMMRFGGSSYGNTGYTLTGGATMDLVAAENQSDTNKGAMIVFNATTPGTNVRTANVMSITGSSVVLNSNTSLKLLSMPIQNGVLYLDGANTVTQSANVIITDSLGTLSVANTTISKDVFVSGNVSFSSTLNNVTVTQIASKSNTVTANGRTGQITTSNAALNKGVAVQFTVNNNYVVSNKDIVILNIASGATVGYDISVNNIQTGSFQVNLHNSDSTPSGSNASDALVINFLVFRVNT